MSETDLTAYIPIPMPYRPDGFEDAFAVVSDALEELCELSESIRLPMGKYGEVIPRIQVLESPDQVQLEAKDWLKIDDSNLCGILKISANLMTSKEDDEPYSEAAAEILKLAHHIPPDTCLNMLGGPENVRRIHTRHIFEKRIYDIVVAANLASVGSIAIDQGIILQDDHAFITTKTMSADSLREAPILASRIGWPKLESLSFANAWEWISTQDDFLNGFTRRPVGRALSAFAHLFDDTELGEPLEEPDSIDPIKLFWALIGVEALYCRGKVGLIAQLKEKSTILLGKQDEFKKKVGQMYKFRSKFVHGELDFPGSKVLYPATSHEKQYYDDLREAMALAEAILAATLQRLISQDRSELEFSYQIDASC